jgi:uncharacterized protein YkwD
VSTVVQAQPAHRVLAAITASFLVLAALVTGAITAQSASASTVEDTFTHKLNHARTSRGIPALHVSASLVRVARAQAARMASRDLLYHNPNLTTDVKHWRYVGENVGYGPAAKTVHHAFMHSPPHRANILDRDYTQVGIGSVTKNGRVWVAQVFRRPMKSSSSSFSFTKPLRLGSTGTAVRAVQRRLGVNPTGHYGTDTRRAVRHYQRSHGWSVTGVVGHRTWQRLF